MQEKPEEHFEGLVAQKAIIRDGEKILFVRNLDEIRWDFPGGRLNKQELPSEGLLRELREELNIDGLIKSVVYIGQYFHGGAKKDCLFINYRVDLQTNAQIQLAADELSDYKWIPVNDLKESETFPNCWHSLQALIPKL